MIKKTAGYLYLGLIIVFVFSSLTSCATTSSSMQAVSKQSCYDRVIQSGKIRCGYLVYPPGCYKDPNTGKLSGIGVDTIELVAKKLGLSVEWTEEVNWSSMLEGLVTGRYDMIPTTVWTNANRAKIIGFSKPLFYSPVYVFTRKGDVRFKNHWDLINSPKIKVATIDGGTVNIIAESDFPQSGRISIPQTNDVAQLLLNVATGKADVTFAEMTTADRYMRNNPGTIENLNSDKPIRVFGSCWMFGRDELEFKAMLDTVLDEVINSGAMDKIISKYEKVPNEVLRVALPYQLPKQ